jgi:hypothetical protein
MTGRHRLPRGGVLGIGSLLAAILWTGFVTAAPTGAAGSLDPPFPIDERLHYKVSWLGIHCGNMTLTSFAEPVEGDVHYHVVMTARTTSFFDGIYRVRARLESWFSGALMSSVRYHDVRNEKKKHDEELYEFDAESGKVIRTRRGEVETFEFDRPYVHDPLAYVYRLRALVRGPSEAVALDLASSDGAIETIAVVQQRKKIKTPLGRVEAFQVVPQPRDEMLFSKKGRMEIWMGTDERRVPYRIEFDLSFGKLTAKLVEMERGDVDVEGDPFPEGRSTGIGGGEEGE